MSVIGIDQSLRATGLFWTDGVTHGWKQVDTGGLRGAERLLFIRDAIASVVDAVKPELAALEGYSYGSPGKVFELGEIGGAVKMLLQERKIPFVTPTPVQVKKFATSRHMAEKIDVVNAINTRYGVSWVLADNNLADAAALAAIASACLAPATLTLRHEAEVVAAIQNTVKPKKATRKPKRRRLTSI
jgi:crossover junction endodeoxyribonuclease RuvC